MEEEPDELGSSCGMFCISSRPSEGSPKGSGTRWVSDGNRSGPVAKELGMPSYSSAWSAEQWLPLATSWRLERVRMGLDCCRGDCRRPGRRGRNVDELRRCRQAQKRRCAGPRGRNRSLSYHVGVLDWVHPDVHWGSHGTHHIREQDLVRIVAM